MSVYRDQVRAYKRSLVEHAIARAGGNHAQAAKALGVGRTYLVRLMHDLGLPVRAPAKPGQRTRVA